MQTGQTAVFGGASSARLSQPQNIFDFVFNCTWISNPMTGSSVILEVQNAKRKMQNIGIPSAFGGFVLSFAL
jgi:hypothetical protein